MEEEGRHTLERESNTMFLLKRLRRGCPLLGARSSSSSSGSSSSGSSGSSSGCGEEEEEEEH